jgi:hypothetical protein
LAQKNLTKEKDDDCREEDNAKESDIATTRRKTAERIGGMPQAERILKPVLLISIRPPFFSVLVNPSKIKLIGCFFL